MLVQGAPGMKGEPGEDGLPGRKGEPGDNGLPGADVSTLIIKVTIFCGCTWFFGLAPKCKILYPAR